MDFGRIFILILYAMDFGLISILNIAYTMDFFYQNTVLYNMNFDLIFILILYTMDFSVLFILIVYSEDFGLIFILIVYTMDFFCNFHCNTIQYGF